jgi:hypothetical protein
LTAPCVALIVQRPLRAKAALVIDARRPEACPSHVEVEQDPALVGAGHDPQLEKAADVVMTELKRSPRRPQDSAGFPKYPR